MPLKAYENFRLMQDEQHQLAITPNRSSLTQIADDLREVKEQRRLLAPSNDCSVADREFKGVLSTTC